MYILLLTLILKFNRIREKIIHNILFYEDRYRDTRRYRRESNRERTRANESAMIIIFFFFYESIDTLYNKTTWLVYVTCFIKQSFKKWFSQFSEVTFSEFTMFFSNLGNSWHWNVNTLSASLIRNCYRWSLGDWSIFTTEHATI